MRKDKTKALKLRKEGSSYNQISRSLLIPKSTLSAWLKGVKLSSDAQKKISERVYMKSVAALIRRNKNQTILAEDRAKKIRENSKREAIDLMKSPLFVAGVALYWAEGYKKGAVGSKWKCIDFTNSDPEMIELMMRFFRKVLKVNDKKIRIQLLAHPNVDIEKSVDYWSRLTNIPPNQFIKTCCSISKSSGGKRDKKTLTNGTVHIRISDVGLFFRVIGWIDGLKSKLLNRGP